MLRKNVASQFLHFAGVNASTGAALTGATFSYRRCIDGTFAAGGGTITEDTGTGFYKVALAQADTNGNDLGFFFTATSAIPVCINALTTAADPSDTVRYGLTAMPAVASGSAGAIVTSGTGTAQLSVSAGLVTLAGVTHTGAVIPTVTTTTTATNLTNLPAITAGWLTAAGIAAGALDGKGNWNIGKTGYSLTATTGLGDQTANITGNLSGSVGSVTGAVGSVTGAVGSVTGNVTGSVGSLATQAKADVNAEVLDVLNTDTFAEPGQGAPAATATLAAKINYLYKAWRNKKTQTATVFSLFADDTITVDQKATVGDDGTTTTVGEIATGL